MTGTLGFIAIVAQEFIDVHIPIPEFGESQFFTILIAFVKVGAIGFAVLWILSFIDCEISAFKRWRERNRYREMKEKFSSYKYRDKI